MTIYTKKDEPVAWYWQGQAPRVSVEKPYNVWRQEWIPLYTRPNSSELMKAAEEALKLLVNLEGGYGFEDDSEYAVLDNLRAALEAI